MKLKCSLKAACFSTLLVTMSGCGSDTRVVASQPPAARPAGATSGPNAGIQASLERLPVADASVLFDRYERVDRPDQIAALYYAVSGLPVDYPKLAEFSSQEYRSTSDEFRKRELMQALKPAIDNAIQQFRADRYFWVSIAGVQMEHFDFNSRSFPLRAPWIDENSYVYFNNSTYTLGFTNGSRYGRFTVQDEAVARPIEERVSRYDAVDNAQVYLFAQAVDMNTNRVKCQITRISLLDRRGIQIGELSPSPIF